MLCDGVEHGRRAALEHADDDELREALLDAALVALAACGPSGWKGVQQGVADRRATAQRREGEGAGSLAADAPSDHSRRTRSGQNLLSAWSCSFNGTCFG